MESGTGVSSGQSRNWVAMSRSIAQRLPVEEVNRVEPASERASDVVNKVDRLPAKASAMASAKLQFGAAIAHAIGDDPLKHYGDKGHISNVISGEKVPDYLAKICDNPKARRRLAMSLLRGDKGVRKRIVLDWDDDEEEIA